MKFRINVDEQGADWVSDFTDTGFTIAGRDSEEVVTYEGCDKEVLIQIIQGMRKHRFADITEVVNEEYTYLNGVQADCITQLNSYKEIKMDWTTITEIENAIQRLRYIASRLDATERIKNILEHKERKEK